MGYDVAVPELPVDKIAPSQPLRAAILAWIAATGSTVPPGELAEQLLRADALPLDVQRDVALLLLSTIEATTLQRAALARLTPEQLAWISAHPELAVDLAEGKDTPETRLLALMAAQVDMAKSLEATLLLLQAVEATRGSFESRAAAQALEGIDTASLDATTKALLALLLSADANASDAEKVRLAAQLVATGAGIELPAPVPTIPFSDALARLTAASGQVAAPSDVADVVGRATALPDDLEAALSRLLLAEANAINAAHPARLTQTSQQEALVGVLLATADALPVLEKYSLYWRDAPAALRLGEWEPNARVAWAAHHAALLRSTNGGLVEIARASAMVNGHTVSDIPVIPALSFADAYAAMLAQGGASVDAETLDAITQASLRLDPATRDAATALMSGAAESARLYELAFAQLSPAERATLVETRGVDALYAKADLSEAELAQLAHASALAQRVDADALWQSAAVATLATQEAKDILAGRGTYRALGTATPVETGLLAFLKRLLPFTTASAQGEGCEIVAGVVDTCGEDVLLRLHWPTLDNGMTPAETNAVSYLPAYEDDLHGSGVFTCDERQCMIYAYGFREPNFPAPQDGKRHDPTGGEVTTELLVITGSAGSIHTPATAPRRVCPSVLNGTHVFPTLGAAGTGITFQNRSNVYVPTTAASECRYEDVIRYGAPTLSLDMGGDDTYAGAVGVVMSNATLPVSLHVDVGGSDTYADATNLYDARSPFLMQIGANNGHPSTASAPIGGIAIVLDAADQDNYLGASWSQGYARFGFALLADIGATSDNYEAERASQGAAADTFTLGAGILFDNGGSDSYDAVTGQGYGLGGILLDVGGQDGYTNERDPNGAPLVANLDILPGGDVTTVDERGDNRVWLDGPGSLSVGIGVDTEVVLTGGQSDQDGVPDFVEFLVGTDAFSSSDSPVTHPTARVDAFLADADEDLYPDYIERALSTDPEDRTSYPAGFPSGPGIVIPAAVWEQIDALEAEGLIPARDGVLTPTNTDTGTGDSMRGSDKIVDLRLPLQDAGTLEYACTGEFYQNVTAPLGLRPGDNLLNNTPVAMRDINENTPRRTNGEISQRCVYVSYDTTSPGEGTASLPSPGDPTTGYGKFTFKLPAGILAVGDVVPTNYSLDYFLVVDLGGDDVAWGSPGGALPVITTPTGDEDERDETFNATFWAPSLFVNLDLRDASAGVVNGTGGRDVYANATRDYAHGALYGVLLDNAGADVYVARDASQGALGGILLDLAGTDSYTARHLSQGAGLAHVPSEFEADPSDDPERADLPRGGAGAHDGVGGQQARAHRRALSGMLLDLGDHPGLQVFRAQTHSQGFARGFADAKPGQHNAPHAQGILASIGTPSGGSDLYTYDPKLPSTGYLQGVGGTMGTGILLDRTGRDTYSSPGKFSQGATISQMIGTNEGNPSDNPSPATGILVDIAENVGASMDTYFAGKAQSEQRNQRTTITRAESATLNANGKLYGDVGLHVDTVLDATSPEAFVAGIGGANATTLDGGSKSGFEVYLPSARLAIGNEGPTNFTDEFAFAVDLGGNNTFAYSAGGFIDDVLGRANQTADPAPTGVHRAPLALFPVSFVLDASNATSTYVNDRTLSQGAGFFTVGVLADLGGRDTLTALADPLPSLNATWLNAGRPTIDANVGLDWQGVKVHNITLGARDARFESTWQLRIANDNRSLYLALEGPTMSDDEGEHRQDKITIDLDIGRRHVPWDLTNNKSGLDEVELSFSTTDKCVAKDRGFNNTSPVPSQTTSPFGNGSFVEDAPDTRLEVLAFEADCRYTNDGRVIFELRKDLIRTESPPSRLDLDYCWQDTTGFGYQASVKLANDQTRLFCESPATELGIYIEFDDRGAGFSSINCTTSTNCANQPAQFSFPPGADRRDGYGGGAQNMNLSDEMAGWAAVGLANGRTGIPPIAARLPSLSQGAGIAGVGVVAMLGSGHSESTLVAADRSQAYGAFGGLGMIVDLGGSDTYAATQRAQGAAENVGAAVLIELEGNDNYLAPDKAYGWVPNETGFNSAIFVDMGGDDTYNWPFLNTSVGQSVDARTSAVPARVDQARAGVLQENQTLSPDGNNVVWVQNTTGYGVDYRLAQTVRDLAANALGTAFFGPMNNSATERNRTYLNMTVYEPGAPDADPATGCTMRPLEAVQQPPEGVQPHRTAALRGSGKVCFIATVDTNNGRMADINRTLAPLRPFAATSPAASAELVKAVNATRSINVSAVEFSIDRERVATVLDATRWVTKDLSMWAAVVDLSGVEDGVKAVKATAIYEARWDERSVVLFADGADNKVVPEPNLRTLVVDNVPSIDVGLEPVYSGRANATFSPLAYGSSQSLFVNWSVSHDASEDHLERANGWELQRRNMSFPCDFDAIIPSIDQPDLCHQLALFLPADDTGRLTTSFNPTVVQSPANVEVETVGGARYGRETDPLRTDLVIAPEGSFHLALPNRTALLPNKLWTNIQITLKENGQPLKTTPGGDTAWVLAGDDFQGGSGAVPGLGVATALFSPVQNTVKSTTGTVRTVASAARDNPFTPVVTAVKNCPADIQTASPQCQLLNGDVGQGNFRPCRPEGYGPDGTGNTARQNLAAWVMWYAVQVVERGGTHTPKTTPQNVAWPVPNQQLVDPVDGGVVCRQFDDDVAEQEPTFQPIGDLAGVVLDQPAVDQALGVLDPNTGSDAINFTDFWFDVRPRSNAEIPAHLQSKVWYDAKGYLHVREGITLALSFDVVATPGSENEPGGAGATLAQLILGGVQPVRDTGVVPSEEDLPQPVCTQFPSLCSGPGALDVDKTVFDDTIKTTLVAFGQNVDGLVGEQAALPSSFFFTQVGGAYDHQSRLEIRVPSNLTTNVEIKLEDIDPETGDPRVVRTLRDAALAAGDIPGTATRSGDVAETYFNRTTQDPCAVRSGNPQFFNACYWKLLNDHNGGSTNPYDDFASDGDVWNDSAETDVVNADPVHVPRINWTHSNRSADRWTQHNLSFGDPEDTLEGVYRINVTARDGSDQESYRVDTVLIDQTPPETIVNTPAFVGKGLLFRGSSLPVSWSSLDVSRDTLNPKPGAGINKVYLFYRLGLEETEAGGIDNMASWKGPLEFSPGTTSLLVPNSETHYLIMTIGEDLAGNIEGTADEPDLQTALQVAFQKKISAGANVPGGYRHTQVDLNAPRFSDFDVLGGRRTEFEGSEFVFARAGEKLTFSVCALDGDAESGIEDTRGQTGVRLELDHADPVTDTVWEGTYAAEARGGCGEGGTLFVSEAWHEENARADRFPEGLWEASFRVQDRGGNVIRVPVAAIILDHRSPTVRVEPPVLPAGQSAVKVGDLVKIRFTVDDTFGVDMDKIRVDASALSKNASSLAARPVRVNGVIYQEAQFTVDRLDLVNAEYNVLVKVPDLSGNMTIEPAVIGVNVRPFDFIPGSFSVSNVTHNSFVLHWRTTDDTTAMAKLGTTSIALNARTPLDANVSREHALKVENLLPSTKYFVRAVSSSTGGLTKESDLIEVETRTALFLQPVLPVANDKVSGVVKVAFKGGLLDSADFVSYTLEVRDSPAKNWTFVTTATRQGDTHELSWNSTRFLDGTTYELRLTAEAGRDVASVVIGPITSDNTPASVLVISPLLATNDTSPRVMAEAYDALSGLTATPAALFIDGKPVAGSLSLTPLPEGRVRIEYDVPSELPPGVRAFELRVEDKAGNVAKESWKVAIDGDAPVELLRQVRYAPGTAAAKQGGTVTLNLTFLDTAGVSIVTANVSSLAPDAPELRLVKIVNAPKEHCTIIPPTPAGQSVAKTIFGAFVLALASPMLMIGGEESFHDVSKVLLDPTVPATPGRTTCAPSSEWQGTFTVDAADASATKLVHVRATDQAGNVRAVTIEVPVDNVAPVVGATSIVETGHTRVGVKVPANEPILVTGTATAPLSPAVTVSTVNATNEPVLTFVGLLPSRTYTYQLKVTDRAGNEVPLAGSFATREDTIPPSPVGNLSVHDFLNGTLRISWPAASDDVGVNVYRVYRSEDNVTFRIVAEVKGTSYEDAGLPYEKPYVYKVAAVDHGANEGAALGTLSASATAVPSLTVGLVSPTVGTVSTSFRYSIVYTSPGGKAAAHVRVILDGVPQNMTLQSGDAKTGAVYVYETRLAPHKRDEPHTYTFEASDGRYTVVYPDDGTVMRGPLVSGDAGADASELAGFANFAQRVPMGGIASLALAFVAAVGLAAIIRKKKEGSK